MVSETYVFQEAEPVKRAGRQGAGRKKEPNPLHDTVAGIVGQTREDGLPKTVESPFRLDEENGETLRQRHGRIRRAATRAGKELGKVHGRTYNIDIAITDVETGETLGVKRDGDRTRGVFSVKVWDRNAGK